MEQEETEGTERIRIYILSFSATAGTSRRCRGVGPCCFAGQALLPPFPPVQILPIPVLGSLASLSAWAVWVCVAVLVCLLPAAARAEKSHGYRMAFESISADDLKEHVDVLADDVFEGREAGSRGGRAAATYLRKTIERSTLPGRRRVQVSWQPFSAGYRNLLVLVEGSHPELRREVVVVGAHYDHVGYGTRRNSYGPIGRIHNGADDNASGAAAIVELIDAFEHLDQPPSRSVLFALWDGEEKGLLGSRHWVLHPTLPLADVKIVVNLDMVGRLRHGRLQVLGTRTSWGLRRLVSQAADEAAGDSPIWLDFKWELKANSDHWPFYERAIPVLLFHTGLHPDYHRPSDDVERINREGMRDVVRHLFPVVYQLAEQEPLYGFRAAARRETPATKRDRQRPTPPPSPRLGVRWREEKDSRGAVLADVTPGSPARRAGLRAGDRIIRFAGRDIASGEQLREAVLRARRQVRVLVQRPAAAGADQKEKPLELTITLAGKPVRVGISWRVDEAEPGSVMLTRVLAGSPAHHAGLRVWDRIYQVDGAAVTGSTAFGQQLARARGPVMLRFERQGRLHSATLQLPPAADLPPARQSVGEADEDRL